MFIPFIHKWAHISNKIFKFSRQKKEEIIFDFEFLKL